MRCPQKTNRSQRPSLRRAPSPLLRAPSERRGTTTIEAAFVLPVFFFLVLAIIEFGHAQMVINVMQSACRNGARLGSTEGTTTQNVEDRVHEMLGAAFETEPVSLYVLDAGVYDSGGTPPSSSSEIEALDPIELSDADPRQLFVVRATVPYNDIALVPMPFMSGVVLDGQAFMRHE